MRFLLVSLALVICFHATVCSSIAMEALPPTRKVEGRVTLEYIDGNQRVKNKLAFTEVADTTTSRSKVSIGHVSYEPKVYHIRGNTVIRDNSINKKCEKLPDDHKLLPELDFFIRYSYTDREIADALSGLQTNTRSPVAIMLMNINRQVSVLFELVETASQPIDDRI